MFDAGKFDVAHLIYPTFKSALAQDPTVNQLIPVPAPAQTVTADAVVEYEPGEEEILEELLPRYVRTQLFGALLEREASRTGRVNDRDGQRHAQRGRPDQQADHPLQPPASGRDHD